MRCLALPVVVLLTMAAVRAADLTVTADPPLPVANLIVNPGLEAGVGPLPANWDFTTAMPEIFETAWRGDGRSGRCLWMKARTGDMSGYFNQIIPVQPGKQYLVKGFYRLATGMMLIYAHNSIAVGDGRRIAVDERFQRGTMRGHWLVPVFLPPEALGGPDPRAWLPFRLPVRVPEGMRDLAISLGLYFQPGEVSFDDLWAGPATTDLTVKVNAAAGETLSRVVLTRAGEEKPIFDSSDLQAGATQFESAVTDQPTDAVYEVAATLGSGHTIRCRYPTEGEVQ